MSTTDVIAQAGGYKRCERSAFPFHKTGSHCYKVSTVTTPLVGAGRERKNYFFVDSIAMLEHAINQREDWMRKEYAGYYKGIKNNYITAYYVTRRY